MRTTRFVMAAAAALALAMPAAAQQAPSLQLPRPSQKAVVSQTIGTVDMSVTYSRPGVKGRTIWGELVPWDKPWRTGANEATRFVTSGEISVEGQKLPAGSYALVTIPKQNGSWTVIFNKQAEMWGAYAYKPEEDQLRVDVASQPAEHAEWMQFGFDDAAPTSTVMTLRWEKVRVPVKIDVDVPGKVLADARAAVDAAAADDWRTPLRAANWANDNNLAPDDVAKWSAKALATKEHFSTLALAAKLSAKGGDTKTAIAQMTKAIALGKADKDIVAEQIAPNEKLLAEWTAAGGAAGKKSSKK